MKPNLAFSDRIALQASDALDSRRERGFTLIEVLITVFILCLGLLGVGSLQYLSMKSNQSALARAVATEYAYQVLDYIRSFPGLTMVADTDLGTTSKCDGVNFCNPGQFIFYAAKANPDAEILNLFTQLKDDLGEDAKMSVCLSQTAVVTNATAEDCTGAPSTFSSGSDRNKYYVVTIQASDRASANSEPIQIVVVGEVL